MIAAQIDNRFCRLLPELSVYSTKSTAKGIQPILYCKQFVADWFKVNKYIPLYKVKGTRQPARSSFFPMLWH